MKVPESENPPSELPDAFNFDRSPLEIRIAFAVAHILSLAAAIEQIATATPSEARFP